MDQPQPPQPAAAPRARRQIGTIVLNGAGGPGHPVAAPAPAPLPPPHGVHRPQQLLEIKVMANGGGVGGADDGRGGRLSPPPQYKSTPALPTPTTCASVASLDDSYVLLVPLLWDGCTGISPPQ